MLIATSMGLGPFHPAIQMNGCTYIHPDTFESEDEAIGFANELCQVIDEKAFEMIIAAYFKAQP